MRGGLKLRQNRPQNQRPNRGDTLVEVAMAFAVLGLVLAATAAIINNSLMAIKDNVERTSARANLNAQEELLRYIYDHGTDVSTPMGKVRDAIDRKVRDSTNNNSAGDIRNNYTCQAGKGAFYLDAAALAQSGTPDPDSIVKSTTESATVADSVEGAPTTSANGGVWIQAIAGPTSEKTPGYIDFYIRACWTSHDGQTVGDSRLQSNIRILSTRFAASGAGVAITDGWNPTHAEATQPVYSANLDYKHFYINSATNGNVLFPMIIRISVQSYDADNINALWLAPVGQPDQSQSASSSFACPKERLKHGPGHIGCDTSSIANIPAGKYNVYFTTANHGNYWENTVTGGPLEVHNTTNNRFGYTGGVRQYTADKTGVYFIYAIGAPGGSSNGSYEGHSFTGGRGGGTQGYVMLNRGDTLYFAVGGVGSANNSGAAGGWNGGGNARQNNDSNSQTGSGGGATSITTRLRGDGQLKNYRDNQDEVLLAAGGGGGGNSWWHKTVNTWQTDEGWWETQPVYGNICNNRTEYYNVTHNYTWGGDTGYELVPGGTDTAGWRLDVSGGPGNGHKLNVYWMNGTEAQRWYSHWEGTSNINRLYTVTGGQRYYMDLNKGSYSKNADDLQVWSDTQGSWNNNWCPQRWLLDFKTDSLSTHNIMYGIRTSCGSQGYVLDVVNGQFYNGNRVRLWDSNNTDAQHFWFKPATYTTTESRVVTDCHWGQTGTKQVWHQNMVTHSSTTYTYQWGNGGSGGQNYGVTTAGNGSTLGCTNDKNCTGSAGNKAAGAGGTTSRGGSYIAGSGSSSWYDTYNADSASAGSFGQGGYSRNIGVGSAGGGGGWYGGGASIDNAGAGGGTNYVKSDTYTGKHLSIKWYGSYGDYGDAPSAGIVYLGGDDDANYSNGTSYFKW